MLSSGVLRHAAGAVIGAAGFAALAFTLLAGAADFEWMAIQAGVTSTPSASTAQVNGSVPAAVFFTGALLVAGALASSRWVSPVAPLLAGLPFFALGLYSAFHRLGAQELATRIGLHGREVAAWNDLALSGIYLVLGGALLVSAAMPWRWRGRPEPARTAGRDAYGVLIGIIMVPALWVLIQLSDPLGWSVVAKSIRVPYLDLAPPLVLAVLIGGLATARWVSPVAAAIAGVPLLAVGLLLAMLPVPTVRVIDGVVWSHPLQFGAGQVFSLGGCLLFGGLLAVSAAAPWRWRRRSGTAAPGGVPGVSGRRSPQFGFPALRRRGS